MIKLSWLPVFFPLFCLGQDMNYDSVKTVFERNRVDSVRLDAGLELTRYYRFNAPSQGVKFADACIALSKKTNNRKKLGEALHYKASAYYQMAAYDSSEKYNRQALAIRESVRDEKGMAGTLTNLGQLVSDQGRTKEGFEYLHRAEKIYEKLKDDRLLAMVYNSLGNLYYGQKLFQLAYDYHFKALKKRQQLGDEQMIVYSYNNLGHITYELYGTDSAAYYYEEGANKARLLNDRYILVQSLNNLGSFYTDIHQEEKARKVLEESIRAGEGTDFENLLANTYMNYARILFYKDKNTATALNYAEKGSKLVRTSGMIEMILESDNLLAKMYSNTGNYAKAYEYLRNAYLLRDSLTKNEIREQITELEARYGNEKKQLEIRNLKNEQKLKNAELDAKNSDLERKTTLLALFTGGSILLVILAAVVFSAYKRKKRDGELIQAQKKQVEEQNRLILHQKAEVEEKQKEILDSIYYAQRIQKALMATDKMLHENLPEHFVLFMPKDIVSGDFYWATVRQQAQDRPKEFYLAVCDSTGHGVPGAFMSLLNISFLNEAINEKNIRNPAEIFGHVRQKLIENISQDEQKDGMDGVLFCFEENKMRLACANNHVLVLRNNEVIEISADRMPVGKSPRDHEPFTLHEFKLQHGDCVYAFTDGFSDQFGGESGKKFKQKNLVELIKTIHHHPMHEQKKILQQHFHQWQGKLEQLDDVLVTGIRIH